MNRDILKEDLRTATFIVRPDEDHFQFAHRSLQEFFLASHLYRALLEDQRDIWRIDSLSLEIDEFLAQIFLTAVDSERSRSERHLQKWLADYQANSSEQAFRFWLRMVNNGQSLPRPPVIDLESADLSCWQIAGKEHDPLNLRSCCFKNTDLEHIVFSHADLSHSDFRSSKLWRREFHEVTLDQGRFESSDLSASLWCLRTLNYLQLADNDLNDSQWIRNRHEAVTWPKRKSKNLRIALLCDRAGGAFNDTPVEKSLVADWFFGHSGGVNACAFSPDGRHIVSGSDDSTLRLWDAESAECLYTFSHLPKHQSATIDEKTHRISHASKEAWRWLGYRDFDPKTGEARIWPAEIFGPLPD